MLGWLTLLFALLAGLFLFMSQNGGAFDTMPAGIAAAGVIALLAGFYVSAQRWHWRRGVSLLLAAVAVLCAGYAVWWYGGAAFEALRDTSQSEQIVRGEAPVSLLIRRDAEGFVAQGQINGADAEFLIDTGAATVMILYSDAEKAGIDVGRLSFTTPVSTANGTIYAAPTRLRSVGVGLITVQDVEALVAKPGTLNRSLLGMSFLRRLSSYSLKGEFLTLRR